MDQYFNSKSFVFIGRGLNYPTALEGALKLKELSYIHATGYPAGELKHGPIALIDDKLPGLYCAQDVDVRKDDVEYTGSESTWWAVDLIATDGDETAQDVADDVIYIPAVSDELSPLVTVIPLQIMSYYIALKLECDVDQPRNLAKSVTVE